MIKTRALLPLFFSLTLAVCGLAAFGSVASAQHAEQSGPAGVLHREEAGAILPPSVFFRGQTASIQARNSAGVRSANGRLTLAAMVDTSGYSSGVAQTYQAYLITESPLRFGPHTLAPGAYGFGFVDGHMIVMDLGGNKLFEAPTASDPKLQRPMPLQIVADGTAYKLYLGRTDTPFSIADSPAHTH